MGRTIVVCFDYNLYTKEHNEAMRYLVANLSGVTVKEEIENKILLEVNDDAYAVIYALSQADCICFH